MLALSHPPQLEEKQQRIGGSFVNSKCLSCKVFSLALLEGSADNVAMPVHSEPSHYSFLNIQHIILPVNTHPNPQVNSASTKHLHQSLKPESARWIS